jgi:anti-sigma factor RsiW
MTAGRLSIGDADLHAYVDGELDQETHAEIEAWFAGHADDKAKVEAWKRQNAALHAGFDGVLDEPLPKSLRRTVGGGTMGRTAPVWMRIAAAMALFALGAASGWGLNDWRGRGDEAAVRFVQRAMGAHAVYLPEVRHPVEVGADQEKHLVAWLSKRLGGAVRAPGLTEAGFRLVGGRLLPDAGLPAAQFMYEDGGGRRVMLYVRRGRLGKDTAFRFVSEGGVAAFYWIDGPMGYALTGKVPRPDLLRLARLVYDQLEN